MTRLDELERKFADNPRRYFAPLANEYRKAGDAGRAVDLCRAQLPEIPGHISGHIVLGQALYDVGDYPGSRSALEAALTLDPENIVALRYLGDIARETGDTVQAAKWYTRTLEADPYSEAAQAGLDSLQGAEPEPRLERQDIDSRPPERQAAELEAPGFESPGLQYQDLASAESKPAELEPADLESPELESAEPQVAEAESPESPHADSESPAAETDLALEVEMAAPLEAPDEPADIAEPSTDIPDASAEFTGDLEVSAVTESVDDAVEGAVLPEIAADMIEPVPAGLADVVTDVVEGLVVDVEAHRAPEPVYSGESRKLENAAQSEEALHTEEALHAGEANQPEEAMQAEERVLEAAAPFVTETMADLYLEQGYPHEALELMLQLAEQRPEDESLRVKIDRIESAIVARRDAAVAAARAERAEVTETQQAAAAPSDAAVAEVDSTISVATPDPFQWESPEPEPSWERAADSPAPAAVVDDAGQPRGAVTPSGAMSVREMFARMDGSRPRGTPAAPPQPVPVLRSDFVPMPEARSKSGAERKSVTGEHRAAGVPRSSGPHQTFDPSTAGIDDFDAWLRGLKGP